MIRFSSVLAGLALGAAVAPAVAQDMTPAPAVHYAKYDMATRTYTVFDSDPDVGIADDNPTVLYDNSTTNGYFTTGGGAIKTTHFMDWGTFATGGGLGANITEFRMAYVTSIAAPTSVDFRMRFYDGATGNGSDGTVNPNGDLLVTGLPNATTAGTPAGWIVDVTLVTPITLADGAFGWSYNSDTGGSVTGTGPFLAGPPNAPGAGAAHQAPNTGFGTYDRITESTDTYLATVVGTTVMLSMPIRLKGREIGAPPPAWTVYGDKNKVTLTGTGSATPGSLDNVVHVKCNPAGKDFVLVAGITQADFTNAHLGLHFQAFPWLVMLAPITTPVLTGSVDLPAPFPVDVPVGTNIYMQVFAQNLAGAYKNWSEGLQVTVQ
jgi:hypothetical protein